MIDRRALALLTALAGCGDDVGSGESGSVSSSTHDASTSAGEVTSGSSETLDTTTSLECAASEPCGLWCEGVHEVRWCRGDFDLLDGRVGLARADVDAAGRIVLVADYAPHNWGFRALITALTPAGELEWQASSALDFRAQDVTVVVGGEVIVVGRVDVLQGQEPSLLRLSSAGALIEERRVAGADGSYLGARRHPEGGFIAAGSWEGAVWVERRDDTLDPIWAQSWPLTDSYERVLAADVDVLECGVAVVSLLTNYQTFALVYTAEGALDRTLSSIGLEDEPSFYPAAVAADGTIAYLGPLRTQDGLSGRSLTRIDPVAGEWSPSVFWVGAPCCSIDALEGIPEQADGSFVVIAGAGDSSYHDLHLERRSGDGVHAWSLDNPAAPAEEKVYGVELARSDVDATVIAAGWHEESDAPLWLCKVVP